MTEDVLLTINEDAPGRIVFAFPGRSTVRDVPHFVQAIDSQLNQPQRDLQQIVFDLSKVDAVINTAGRLFDVAVKYNPRCKRRGIKMEMVIPRDVYDDLQQVDRDVLPEKLKDTAVVKGVTLRISDPVTAALPEPTTRPRATSSRSSIGRRACR